MIATKSDDRVTQGDVTFPILPSMRMYLTHRYFVWEEWQSDVTWRHSITKRDRYRTALRPAISSERPPQNRALAGWQTETTGLYGIPFGMVLGARAREREEVENFKS